jgi:hypothetical protein
LGNANAQLIGTEEHDRIPAVLCVLAALEEVLAICAINTLCADRTLAQKRLGKHLFVANDNRPWLVTTHGDHVHVSGLSIETELRRLLLALGGCLLDLVLRSAPYGLPLAVACLLSWGGCGAVRGGSVSSGLGGRLGG